MNCNLLCAIIYRHPNSDLDTFLQKLYSVLGDIHDKKKFCLLAGDFNIDLLSYGKHAPTDDFINTLNSYVFTPHILKPTRITSHSATLIDNIFFNSAEFQTSSGNILHDLSDHLPNFLIISKLSYSSKKPKCFKRDYSKCNEELLRDEFRALDWHNIFHDQQSVSQIFESFYSTTSNLIDKYMPLRQLSRRDLKFHYKPWITPAIQTSIKIKNKLYRHYIKTRSDFSHHKYKLYRNKLNHLIRLNKMKYYNAFFEQNMCNIKQVWTGIRQLIRFKPKQSQVPNRIIKSNKETITNAKDIADEFNIFFSNVGKNLATKIPKTNVSFKKYLDNPQSSSFALYYTTASEIENIISTFSSAKSSGPYSIPTHLLKLLKEVLSYPLEILFNYSFQSGTVPDQFKIAKVIPIHKKGSLTVVSNYRPISLLSVFNKILEKLIYNRVIKYLEKLRIISEKQFGFRSKHSTLHALLLLADKVQRAIDQGSYACGIFLDLCKAFDTVDHGILLSKLEYYGIRGLAHDWFSSYLTNRKQYVSINGTDSNLQNITYGVPQGSVLGPLLFLLYINDMTKTSKILEFHLFADDTNLFLSDKSIIALESKLNNELNLISTWLRANKLSLNIDKTNYVVFHSPQRKLHYNMNISISNKQIENENQVKYLGLFIDCHLSWKPHVHELAKKISRGIGLLSKIKRYVNLNILRQLYHCLVYPFLTYALTVWGNTYITTLKPLIILQKRAVRIIMFSKPDAHSAPLFKQLGILNLKDLVSFHNLLFVYQYHYDMLPESFNGYFCKVASRHNYNTRFASKQSYCIGAPRTNYGKFNVRFCAVKQWNILDEETKLLPLNSFKKQVKEKFLNSYHL